MAVEQHVYLLRRVRRNRIESEDEIVGSALGERQSDHRSIRERDSHGDVLEVGRRPSAAVEGAVAISRFDARRLTVRDRLPDHIPRHPQVPQRAQCCDDGDGRGSAAIGAAATRTTAGLAAIARIAAGGSDECYADGDKEEWIRVHRESPCSTAADIPGEHVGHERSEQHHQHQAAGREEGKRCKPGDRHRPQRGAKTLEPGSEPVPLGNERLHQESIDAGIERRQWPRCELAAQVIGRAHRLIDRAILGEPVVRGVVVDGDQRIAIGNRAADEIGRDNDCHHEDRKHNLLETSQARCTIAVDHQPGERW